jgi:hypothetical protein
MSMNLHGIITGNTTLRLVVLQMVYESTQYNIITSKTTVKPNHTLFLHMWEPSMGFSHRLPNRYRGNTQIGIQATARETEFPW